jgi:hypothetical protein
MGVFASWKALRRAADDPTHAGRAIPSPLSLTASVNPIWIPARMRLLNPALEHVTSMASPIHPLHPHPVQSNILLPHVKALQHSPQQSPQQFPHPLHISPRQPQKLPKQPKQASMNQGPAKVQSSRCMHFVQRSGLEPLSPSAKPEASPMSWTGV